MNVNQNFSEINNLFEIMIGPYKDKIQPEERDWIKQAITDIKNPDKSIKLEDRISRQVEGLHSFTSDQIIHLVNMLQLGIKKDTSDEQVQSYFCQRVAALALQNKIPINRLLMESADKNFAIEVVTQQIRQGALSPFSTAMSLLSSGIDTHSAEVQRMLIEIAKLGAQEDGMVTSMMINYYGIDSSKPEGQKAMIEIAKLAAKQNVRATFENLKNYGIDVTKPDGQQMLIEIALLVARQDGGVISKDISNYGIDASTLKGQQALIEIALIAAQQDISTVIQDINNYGIDFSESKGQEALLEIVKLEARKWGWDYINRNIKKMGIDDSKPEGQYLLIEIALLAAQKDSYGTYHYLKDYNIDVSKPAGQQALMQIAKLVVQQETWKFFKDKKYYGIDPSTFEGQLVLIEIAKLEALQDPVKTFENIKNYGIDASKPEGQKVLIEIAKLAAQKDGKITSEQIINYGIDAFTREGQEALIEIAMLAAQQNAWGISEYIKNYSIDATEPRGLQALIEIAKLAAQQSGWLTSEYIENYGIDASTPEGQQALIEIAKLAAQQDGENTSLYIKNYGIDASTPEGQQALIEIAKLAAQQDGKNTSLNIKNYGIDASTPEGQQALIEIAKLAAQQDGKNTSLYIKNYGIDASTPEGQQALIEIAKLAAQQGDMDISEYIKNYGIDASTPEGQQALIEIAKLAAQLNGWKLSKYILNYGIDLMPEGQKTLIEIAKLAAQNDGWGVSEFIQDYGIDASTPEGQQTLIEIAKLAAKQNGEEISKFIKNYGIDASKHEGQQALIEIAKLAAQQSGCGTSEFIKNYGIDASKHEGQQALIEIAKLAAQQSGRGTSEFIKNYEIDASKPEGQQVLIEIVKLAAQQNAQGTLNHIQNYSLDAESVEGKKRYVELTQFLFACLVKQFPEFKYSDFEQKFEAYSKTCNGNGIESYLIDTNLFEAPLMKIKAGDFPGALNESLGIATALFEMSTDQLQWVQDRMSSIKNKVEKDEALKDKAEMDKKVTAEQTEFLEQWMSLCTLCASRIDLKQLFKENGPLFMRLFEMSPALRIRIIQEVIASSLDPKSLFVERLKAELLNDSTVVKKIAVLPRDLRVAVLEAFLRGCHNGQADRVKYLRELASDTVHALLACFILAEFPMQGSVVDLVLDAIVKDRSFRDAKYQQPLLAALIAIKQSSLQDDKKNRLLKEMFNLKDAEARIQSLKLITDILNFQGESYLGEGVDLASFKSTLERLFIDKCKVKVDNFGALYQNSVGNWRSKEALLTYAGNHVRNPKVLPYFQRYLTAVLQGNFSRIRYTVENNPHLDQIKKSHPKIFEAWQKPVSLIATEITSKGGVKEIPVETRVIENLKQAVVNRHLGLEQQESLFPIVSACIDNWNALDTSLELIEQQLTPLSNRRLNADEMSQKQRLQLQKYLLELIVDPRDLEKKLNDLNGIKIKDLEQALDPFYQDLKDAMQMLRSSKKSPPAENAVMDSDDPNNFLLMGTEVLSSCQNVNGSASLNVGVLGYALDGKHRLALVCDPSGKILARSVLRLLIDSNGQPVLFQEKVYVADASPEYPSLLRKIALKKAKHLGVPLLVSPSDFEKEQAQPYAHAIEAKGKPVPFEYVDALNGLQSGAYRLGKCLQIMSITPSGS